MTEINQRDFWAGQFGDEYIDRNRDEHLLASNINLFSKVLRNFPSFPSSILEIGANIGMNIMALKSLLPEAVFTGVEINEKAAEQLKLTGAEAICIEIEKMDLAKTYDLVLSKGVLIHIAPENLDNVYERIYKHSARWILIAEYYNPSPIGIPYRGHENKLFKRDFAGEIQSKYPHLQLIDYGFAYRGDKFAQDDITWFLLEKNVK